MIFREWNSGSLGRCGTGCGAILSDAKTSTSGLVLAYERENELLPKVGQRMAVVDSEDRPVAAIELHGTYRPRRSARARSSLLQFPALFEPQE